MLFQALFWFYSKKCGISLSLDGSENGEIHIESIEKYELPTANEIT